jgi:hypothetical protein
LVYAVFGSCVCVLLLQSIIVLLGALATGAGGFAALVIMRLAMFPLTLGYLLVISLWLLVLADLLEDGFSV